MKYFIYLFLLVGHPAFSQWNTNGTSVYYSSGNVGVGTSTPSNVQGWDKVINVYGPVASKIIASSGSDSYRVGIYSHATWLGGGGLIGTETNHKLHFMTNYDAKMTLDVNGFFGLNTTTPLARLHVMGSTTAATDNTARFENQYIGPNVSHIHWGTTGDWHIRSASSAGVVVLQDLGGNVGIGTSSPTDKLDVRGNLVLETGDNPRVFTSSATTEQNRYLQVLNSPALHNASGLMAGGILVSDSYSYATPAKNDMVVKGSVAIGTATPGSFKLAVNGKIWAQEVNVQMTNPGPDYVFEKDYNLLSLSELERYISENKHLPEVPSAKEMEEEGLNLKEINLLLLKKVEELTLHVIELKKENSTLAEKMDRISNKN